MCVCGVVRFSCMLVYLVMFLFDFRLFLLFVVIGNR